MPVALNPHFEGVGLNFFVCEVFCSVLSGCQQIWFLAVNVFSASCGTFCSPCCPYGFS